MRCLKYLPGMGRVLAGFAGLCLAIALSGCEREQRAFPQPADAKLMPQTLRQSELQPGQPAQPVGRGEHLPPPDYQAKYENNAYAVSQGRRLYRWFNCNGCHANGGGDIGPPLMDDRWIYGGEPADIYTSILHGRPNGMPSFAGHITEDQLWQIVAYVRSMSGQLRIDTAPSRSDNLQPAEPESRRERQDMRQSAPPKEHS
ncbi:cytochrome c [Methylobacillus flagellatus]|uniref:c-type cytochrome n=1 Tax=Methylobacillus flagellatus TaxID=405 RepID=UPI002869074B|nr:cytochrome c [Methylobacillus flagellatus]